MPTHRLIFLDRLRVLALGALVLYHLGMAYVPWPWHLKGAALVPALEPWMRLLEPWRMSLLFCLSGIVTALIFWGLSNPWLQEYFHGERAKARLSARR